MTTAADWQEAMQALARVAEMIAAGAEAAARVAEMGLPPGAQEALWWHLGPQGRALRLEAAWSGFVVYHIQVALNLAAGARVVAAASVASGAQLPVAARPSTDPLLLGRRSVPAAAAAHRRQGGLQVAEGAAAGTDEAGPRVAADRGTYRPRATTGPRDAGRGSLSRRELIPKTPPTTRRWSRWSRSGRRGHMPPAAGRGRSVEAARERQALGRGRRCGPQGEPRTGGRCSRCLGAAGRRMAPWRMPHAPPPQTQD